MYRVFPVAMLLTLFACTPTMNWRDTPVGATRLHASFPCKPDKAERRVEFTPGRAVAVHALGCESGGASFAVLYADFGAASELAKALEEWKKASLSASRGNVGGEQPFVPAGALALPQSVLVSSRGQRPDGGAMHSQAAYFAHGTHAFQAVVHSTAATSATGEAREPFFRGLRFR